MLIKKIYTNQLGIEKNIQKESKMIGKYAHITRLPSNGYLPVCLPNNLFKNSHFSKKTLSKNLITVISIAALLMVYCCLLPTLLH